MSPKEALMKLLELPPDIVSDAQRRELLMSAYNRQNNITVQFVKVYILFSELYCYRNNSLVIHTNTLIDISGSFCLTKP